MNPELAIGSVWLASEHPGDHLPLLQMCSAVLGFPVTNALPVALSTHLSAFIFPITGASSKYHKYPTKSPSLFYC